MKEKLSIAGQIVLGLVVGNVMGKGMEILAEKAKKAAKRKKKEKEEARN